MSDHLRRARKLGVSLKEYADAYDVDLDTLQSAQAALSDFVPVTVIDNPAVAAEIACHLMHTDGRTLECHFWRTAYWLRSC